MLLPIRMISIWEPKLLTNVKLLRKANPRMAACAIGESDSRRSNSETVILSTGDRQMDTHWWMGIFILVTFVVPALCIFGDDGSWLRGKTGQEQ